MNVDRQDIDPRETIVRNEFESTLTDDESEDEQIRKELELMEKRRQELLLRKQLKEIARAQHLPASITEDKTKPIYFKEQKPLVQTGNALVDKLNVTRRQQQMKEQHQIQLKKARVHTFDCESEYDIKNCNEIDKYSGKRLVQRYIPNDKLDEFFQDKKILRLDKLFAKVVPPDFKEPDYYNWCVVGVVVKKSEPMFTTLSKSSKFMRITISDFQLSVDLTLFDQLFHKYWKLKVGDLVAVLNPSIWINRRLKKFSTTVNAFNISLKHDYDAILEIGKLDIKYCKSVKKNGETCHNIISGKDIYCYYHQELLFKKTTAKRMELNGSFKMYDPVQNGVRQQVLYSSGSNTKINGDIFNDPLAEKSDRFTRLSKGFSNKELLKLFFNDDLRDIKRHYKENQMDDKITVKKRKRLDEQSEDEVKQVQLSEYDRQKLMKQKLKASIIRDQFRKDYSGRKNNSINNKDNNDSRNDNGHKNDDNDDDDDDLDIIF